MAVIAQSVTKYVGASEQAALDGDFYAAVIERLKTGRCCAYLTYHMTRLTRSGVLHQQVVVNRRWHTSHNPVPSAVRSGA